MPTRAETNLIYAKARYRAWGWLARTHRKDYLELLQAAKAETGGCLAHPATECHLSVADHRRRYVRAYSKARLRAYRRLEGLDLKGFRDVYHAEIESEKEKLDAQDS